MRNLYEVLNLTPEATDGQIKNNYRRIAKRIHPDLNPNDPKATEKFRELQDAYEVLSNPEKREAYDAKFTPKQVYRKRNYNRQPYNYRVRPRYHRPMLVPDRPREQYLEYTLELTWEELAKGSKQTITVGQMFTCPTCLGKMRILVEEKYQKCPRCAGWGFLVGFEKVEVLVPPGVLPDMNMRVAIGTTNPSEPSPIVDLPLNNHVTIRLKVKESPTFSHRDQHLYTTIKVPQSLLENGGDYTLNGPEGNLILINIPAHTPSGTVVTVRKQGLRSGSSLRRGNLYCTLLPE